MNLDVNKRAELLADLIRQVPLNGDLEGQIRHVFRQIEQQTRQECAELVAVRGHKDLARMLIAAGPGGREMQRWQSRSTVEPQQRGGSGGRRGHNRGKVLGYRPQRALQLLRENGPMTTGELSDELDYKNSRVSTYNMLLRLAAAGHVQRLASDTWDLGGHKREVDYANLDR